LLLFWYNQGQVVLALCAGCRHKLKQVDLDEGWAVHSDSVMWCTDCEPSNKRLAARKVREAKRKAEKLAAAAGSSAEGAAPLPAAAEVAAAEVAVKLASTEGAAAASHAAAESTGAEGAAEGAAAEGARAAEGAAAESTGAEGAAGKGSASEGTAVELPAAEHPASELAAAQLTAAEVLAAELPAGKPPVSEVAAVKGDESDGEGDSFNFEVVELDQAGPTTEEVADNEASAPAVDNTQRNLEVSKDEPAWLIKLLNAAEDRPDVAALMKWKVRAPSSIGLQLLPLTVVCVCEGVRACAHMLLH
jgi:hypothetical protein